MTLIFLILRVAHIVAGILWARGALALTLFVAPTMSATGDAGKQFAGHLIGKARFSTYMMITGLTHGAGGFGVVWHRFELVSIGVDEAGNRLWLWHWGGGWHYCVYFWNHAWQCK